MQENIATQPDNEDNADDEQEGDRNLDLADDHHPAHFPPIDFVVEEHVLPLPLRRPLLQPEDSDEEDLHVETTNNEFVDLAVDDELVFNNDDTSNTSFAFPPPTAE
mmetsp:Transcript_16734/g.28372  ORF Transcript_16734/g.28372 Transcript_16734/m.28372 type:complete len:106 (+) Transcript_16734:409-726(+)